MASDAVRGGAQASSPSSQADIAAHLDDGHRGEILRDGFRVVLAGPPNAGKSSLLNALARRDAAIVSEEAGTTRDVIEVRLDLDGLPVIVTDTAGIREPQGAIEREGIRRTLAHAREADLVLWLSDASAPRRRAAARGFGARGQVFSARGQQNRYPRRVAHVRNARRVGQDRRGPARAHAPPGGHSAASGSATCPSPAITRERYRHQLIACMHALQAVHAPAGRRA